jgi:CRP-like cAMP-binding protein
MSAFSSSSFLVQRNHLLSLLTNAELEQLLPLLEPVANKFKDVVYQQGNAIDYIYFPCTSVLSVLIFMRDGTAVEVGTVGNEGFASIDILAAGELVTHHVICQAEGVGLRISNANFKHAMATLPKFRLVMQRYLQAYLCQVSQSVACNRLHTIEARFARWVLLSQDRVEGEEFHITQEFLADMLGVRRPSVSVVASAFQNAGVIKYSRGKLQIKDRPALEKLSCECYWHVKSNFEKLLGVKRG